MESRALITMYAWSNIKNRIDNPKFFVINDQWMWDDLIWYDMDKIFIYAGLWNCSIGIVSKFVLVIDFYIDILLFMLNVNMKLVCPRG